jgi:hypothetical protein
MNATPPPVLVDAPGLLKALFDEGSRPTVRWVRDMQQKRLIPFLKIGRMVRFDPVKARAALDKLTVQPRGDRRAA